VSGKRKWNRTTLSTNGNLQVWCNGRYSATRIRIARRKLRECRNKTGNRVPRKEGPPGVPDGVCGGVGLEAFNKAFNAWYPGGSVGVTLGIRWVLIGARPAVVIPVGTLVVFARWAISAGRVK
jgi:hypothetical protein